MNKDATCEDNTSGVFFCLSVEDSITVRKVNTAANGSPASWGEGGSWISMK